MYIHFAIHLNLIQHCKLTIPQEKKILIKKKTDLGLFSVVLFGIARTKD